MSDTKKLVVRLWVLLILLTVGFSLIWLLPKQKEMVISRLSKKLPEAVAGWSSEKGQVSEEERKILVGDTEFARRFYHTDALDGFGGIEVSVVFSGKDINNSLHRPEVCLRAQGWNFTQQRSIVLPGVLPGGGDLPVREIVCVRPRTKRGDVEPPKNSNGDPVYDKRIQYYTFIGARQMVSGHYERTFEDIKARLIGGYDQQWAYVTFSTGVTSVYRDQGFNIPDAQLYDDESSTQIMQIFIQSLLPKVLNSPTD